jgi:hypothetical protein
MGCLADSQALVLGVIDEQSFTPCTGAVRLLEAVSEAVKKVAFARVKLLSSDPSGLGDPSRKSENEGSGLWWWMKSTYWGATQVHHHIDGKKCTNAVPPLSTFRMMNFDRSPLMSCGCKLDATTNQR